MPDFFSAKSVFANSALESRLQPASSSARSPVWIFSNTATVERDDVSDRMGPNNIVMTWRDNQTLVYRSHRIEWNAWKGHLTLAKNPVRIPNPPPYPDK